MVNAVPCIGWGKMRHCTIRIPQGTREMSAFEASRPPSGAVTAIALFLLSMTHWIIVMRILQQVTLN
jgi:hypothetical protein